MEKIFNQNNFNNFVWSPLGSWGNIQVHFQVSAAWYCSHYLPPVSLILVAICHRHRWHRRQICRRWPWHRWQICHRCQQHKGNWWQNLPPVSLIPAANLPPGSLIPAAICHRCTLTCEYFREFSKKFEMILLLLSGAWGKVINEKNLKQKISWQCPFKLSVIWCERTFTTLSTLIFWWIYKVGHSFFIWTEEANIACCDLAQNTVEPKINLNKDFYMFFGFDLYFNKS